MQGRVPKRIGRGQLGGLLASSSVAALLIGGGGAPPAFAGCQIAPGSNQASVSNSGAINCIRIDGITVTGNVTNTDTGTLTATVTSLQSNGIIILNASVGGAVVNAGQITAAGYGNGIFVTSNATVSGGISNSGTIAATLGNGVLIGSTSTVSVTISSFGGGITNSGTITARTGTGIVVGDRSASNVTITISTFAGGITNSGTIAASIDGIWVGGGYPVYANANGFVTISTFAGGISNSGTISAGLDGIFVGGAAAPSGAAIITAISTFSGGITNSTSGSITAGNIGIMVGRTANAGASVTFSTFSGGISNGGTISAGNIGIDVNDVSTFLGGVSNSGTISAGGAGIAINNVAQFGSATSAGGGISNSGIITGGAGIVIQAGVTFAAGAAIVNSGTITGIGGTAIDVSAATSPVTIDINGGAIGGNMLGAGLSSGDTLNFAPSGTFTYDSNFTNFETVNIYSGTVVLNGADSATSVNVNNGATLAGTGSIATALTVLTGGTFAPGTTATKMAITGSLVLQSAAVYMVTLNATNASGANVSTFATITSGAVFALGSASAPTVGTTFTVLTANTGLTGTFSDPTMVFGAYRGTLSYDMDDVFLSVTYNSLISLLPPNPPQNVLNVANGIENAIQNGVTPPAGFQNLFNYTPAQLENALTQLAGQPATGAQGSAFQLMTDFINLLTDPSSGGGGSPTGGGAPGFAPEQEASLPSNIAQAYAAILNKAPPQQPQNFDRRWSAWGSAFGAAAKLDGNPVVGSGDVTASDYGFAAGMDYRATPDSVYGFALAGGGTNWSVAGNLGSGQSDSIQIGVHDTTHWGPFYLSGALAFANHWFTTNRIAVGDQLTAKFDGQSYAARGEAGYRYAVPVTGQIIGVTPYAALQVQDFRTPGFSETDLTGGGLGLSFAAQNATDTRSELGARFDNVQIVNNMPLVLRGRLAWAHDWVSNPALGAVFQALPGSNFTVNGAAPPKNSALTSAGVELHITTNWTAIAKFDGEFAPTAQTYAGTGTLKYSW